MILNPPKTREAPPRATPMLESLRGMGYSPATALADIIDNSISAGATEVRIDLAWAGPESRIAVLDNGSGMSDPELESAMTLGDKSPLDKRSANDLGRFGMGMKTASLSQCRRLTVATVKDGASCCLRWDLNELIALPQAKWLMFEGPAPGSEAHFSVLEGKANGTLVLWELMDRIVTEGYTVQDFLNMADHVEAHLAMVFHRLIQGPRPRLRIFINSRPIAPWDPFMVGRSWSSPVGRKHTPEGLVEVECFVLPHKDKLTEDERKAGAGPNGWTAQQGFYIYRNERLLLAGGWLGLGPGRAWNREESHRLARIRLDIPNTADAAWKIDIKKSTARPPVALRPWLTSLAEHARERARKVFAYRGSPTPSPTGTPLEQAWRVDHTATGVRYRIDEKHPAIAGVLEAAGPLLPMVKAMLRVIQETVPVQRIWLDTAENKEMPRTAFAGEAPAEIVTVMNTIYQDMVGRRGMAPELAKRALLSTDPFQNFPSLIDKLHAADSPAPTSS